MPIFSKDCVNDFPIIPVPAFILGISIERIVGNQAFGEIEFWLGWFRRGAWSGRVVGVSVPLGLLILVLGLILASVAASFKKEGACNNSDYRNSNNDSN